MSDRQVELNDDQGVSFEPQNGHAHQDETDPKLKNDSPEQSHRPQEISPNKVEQTSHDVGPHQHSASPLKPQSEHEPIPKNADLAHQHHQAPHELNDHHPVEKLSHQEVADNHELPPMRDDSYKKSEQVDQNPLIQEDQFQPAPDHAARPQERTSNSPSREKNASPLKENEEQDIMLKPVLPRFEDDTVRANRDSLNIKKAVTVLNEEGGDEDEAEYQPLNPSLGQPNGGVERPSQKQPEFEQIPRGNPPVFNEYETPTPGLEEQINQELQETKSQLTTNQLGQGLNDITPSRLEDGQIIDEISSDRGPQQAQFQTSTPANDAFQPNFEDPKQQIINRYNQSLSEGLFLKNQGNQFYTVRDYKRAIEHYLQALQLCQPYYMHSCPYELIPEFNKLKISLCSNLAVCYLNLGMYNECITQTNLVLDLDPQNMKALYRRAMAFQGKQDFDEACRDIDAAWNLVKDTTQDKEILQKRIEIRKLKKDYDQQYESQSRQMFQRMVSSELKSKYDEVDKSSIKKKKEDEGDRIDEGQERNNSMVYQDSVLKMAAQITASVLLGGSLTKYFINDQVNTQKGVLETVLLSCGTAGAMMMKKTWQKLTFASLTAGIVFISIIKKGQK